MNNSPAPALSCGLEIIELIYKSGNLSFSQIAGLTGFNVSSLNRYIKVLTEAGYLYKTDEGKYSLGYKLLLLGRSDSVWSRLSEKSTPILKEISRKYGVTTLLIGVSSEKIVVLNKATHPDNVVMQKVGSEIEGNRVAPWGILLLTQIIKKEGQDSGEKYLKDHRQEFKILPKEVLEQFIGQAEKNGYCDDRGRILKGVRRLAVPICDHNGNIFASIGVGTFESLHDEKGIDEIIRVMKIKADELKTF
ncbi:MAG: p-hydroxybenzoate hydroxylase transcriptional activator [Firmicutes bacterium ADurb.Bin193]|nr:MAG: p-hydroxybenzoate hydroxylase transcriptional activator [Firmicutes bacterium ADurb.Bin193]